MGQSMEMWIFLSLAFTEILHLKNTWLQLFYIYFKKKMFYLNNYTFLSHQCGNICFELIIKNTKHRKTARAHIQPYREGKCFILRSKTGFSTI